MSLLQDGKIQFLNTMFDVWRRSPLIEQSQMLGFQQLSITTFE